MSGDTLAGPAKPDVSAATVRRVYPVLIRNGNNVFCLSVKLSPNADLGHRVATVCTTIETTAGRIEPKELSSGVVRQRIGIALRKHKDDKALIEPNGNGSLIRFDYPEAGVKKHVLLFANPRSQKAHTQQTLQVCFDDGRTWPEKHHLLLDEGRGAGYPSLTRRDDRHASSVYEGSQAHLVFKKVPLAELLDPGKRSAKDDASSEPDLKVWTAEELPCTPKGQLLLLPGEKSDCHCNRERAAELTKRRAVCWQDRSGPKARAKVRAVVGVRPFKEVPALGHGDVGTVIGEGYSIEKLILTGEAKVELPALAFVPPKPTGQAKHYLHGDGKHTDAAVDRPFDALVWCSRVVLAVDLRGLGETTSITQSRFAG